MARPVPDKDLAYQLFVKTHKLAVVVETPVLSTIPWLKNEVLSALQAFGTEEAVNGVPPVNSVDDFEICRRNDSKYEVLSASGTAGKKTIRELGIKAWERLYLRFRNEEGELGDVVVSHPPMQQDEEEDDPMA